RDSLSVPHRYDITRALHVGENEIVIRVDNRKKIEIGGGHAYTTETQTIWNGIVGEIKLAARDRIRINQLQLRPDLTRGGVEVTITTHNGIGRDVTGKLSLEAEGKSFRGRIPAQTETLTIRAGDQIQKRFYEMGDSFERWSEFNPELYTLRADLSSENARSEVSSTFGMREFKAVGRHFTINGQPTFLRGTLECCIFPETAHPAMTAAKWEKIFSRVKEYGLNHIRFHSWCPPEAAFRVADCCGVYLQVELPNWSFKMGQLPEADEFFRKEGERMIREYGNHPSWVMFSMGNELLGDLDKLDELVAHLKELDPALLFTSTSYSWMAEGAPRGLLPGPNDDYFVSMQTKCGWVRGQGFFNDTAPNTTSDYSEGVSCIPIPLVSHEVGQYNIFPSLPDLKKLSAGPLRAVAWEALKADLEKKGRLNEAKRYTRDSGQLAVLLYKEELERALRTTNQAGIDLLDLHDFPGQSTATVGILNAFWDSKGLISAKQFRRFAGPTVPLARMAKRVFENDEMFEATVEIAHFGPRPMTNAVAKWKLRDGGKVIGRGEFQTSKISLGTGFQLGRIRQSLNAVQRAAKLNLSVEIVGTDIANDWSIWVYPAAVSAKKSEAIPIFKTIDAPLFQALREGKRVLLLPTRESLKAPMEAQFVPMFWSPMANPSKPGTIGATIDVRHSIWKEFPTDSHTDWQWWELLHDSFAINLDRVAVKPTMPFRFVDKFNRNTLPVGIFEVRIGPGRLLVCTLDISSDLEHRIVARQLRRSIADYIASPGFNPKTAWSEETLKSFAFGSGYSAVASSAHRKYPAANAVDGDPDTFWHTDWEKGAALPASLTLEFQRAAILRGFTYLPRQDMGNGRIGKYDLAVSLDGTEWSNVVTNGIFPNSAEKQTIEFKSPIQTRFLRLTARTDLGKSGNAAIAEIEPLIDEQ
ncbi:MAG TPA: discoidin domain-containing protein, partial [Verrucomicrobiae bacterium]